MYSTAMCTVLQCVKWNCSHARYTVARHQGVAEYKLCAEWTTANIFRPKALRTEEKGRGRIEWRYVCYYRNRQSIYGAEHIHAVPARPPVEVHCRQGGSVMASGLLGCAEGKQVEFCLCLVGSGMATVWYLLEVALWKEILWPETNVHYA